MSKHAIAKEKYLAKFSTPEISKETLEDGVNIIHIYTERFHAQSLYTNKNDFNNFSIDIQNLYHSTFNNPITVEKYAHGTTMSIDEFEYMVKLNSLNLQQNNIFGDFIVLDDINDNAVGFSSIDDCHIDGKFKDNTVELSYLFNSNYHRSENIKYVGYECIGALTLFYAESLFHQKALLNRKFDSNDNKFQEGNIFKLIYATARTDNIGSCKILELLGFNQGENKMAYGMERNSYLKDFLTDETPIIANNIEYIDC